MIGRAIHSSACILAVVLIGCSNSQSDSNSQTDEDKSAQSAPGPQSSSLLSSEQETVPGDHRPQPPAGGQDASAQDAVLQDAMARGLRDAVAQAPPSSGTNADVSSTQALSMEGTSLAVPQQELAADLSPKKLVEFLAGADKDMQMIASGRAGISDPGQARHTMKQITKLKLQASQRLKEHADADDGARIEGARGELQALSTLASLGDVKSADQLQQLAQQSLQSDDPRLKSDSRMVLIGFAIESLQNGHDEAADEIITLIDDLANSPNPPDLPAMMVMGQARQVLTQFDHHEQAKRVRDLIIDLFADSSDPQIAKMAAQFAGSVRFDSIDKLRASAVDGQTVDLQQWNEAVGKLIDESADLITVQYLAGAALEFEAVGNESLASATYQIMSERFSAPNEATTREVSIAIAARDARLDVIGKQFDPELPSTGGNEISMEDYRGKVVLMPFWSTGFPESLQVIPMLKKLRDDHPEKISIVGMNLDPAGAKVDTYADQQLGFPSYRSESTEDATMGNPVAARFGVVSMPFVAIINQEGKIEAIDFSGRKLQSTVDRLLGQ